MEYLMEYMARGFVTMLMISMPCVLTAAGIGLVIGILQAVTQVQEQTIAAAPKILGVFLVIIIGGYGYVRLLTNLTTEGFGVAFNVIPKNDVYVLPSDYYKYTKPFQREMNKAINKQTNLQEVMKKTSRGNFSELQEKRMQYIVPPKNQTSKPSLIEQKKIMGR